ncbi:MalY/PatB family protein [Anaeromyxobacter oryzisoli]|uniref:MalY/PatB family protein n=1 Tax=Anaeromyxobacter oryzisoli TaxID=2925408 RepID=UPI001F5AC308|nr:PatB family C-S lyase [Anaeromyxobacter sp. SG63]
MTSFDFDNAPDRRSTDSMKWGRYTGRDVLPLWVADMDFAAAPPILEALRERVAHGVFGYAEPWPSLLKATTDHLAGEYGWDVDPSWIVWLPGVVPGLNVARRAVGGTAFTATPIYPPFLSAPEVLLTAPLRRGEVRWEWDLPAVERALTPECRLFLLCHPHNPTGRAWELAELEAVHDLARRRDLVVCSDEIHCGLVLDAGRRHHPFATLSEDAARRSITLMAPSKTFNVPGLGCAFAVIPDRPLRQRFQRAMRGIIPHVNVLGLVACEAAFRHGGPWHRALLDYLRGNRDHLLAALRSMAPLVTTPVEATYLAWIDARATGLADPQRHFEAEGVGLSAGRAFGPGDLYQGFVRLNFGCPRAVLDEALLRMRRALAREERR